MTRTLEIQIQVPEAASDESLRLAEEKAKEAVILALQQQGELTIREAAAALGLTYEGYLKLLAQHGLPATTNDTDPAVMDTLRQEIRRPQKLLPSAADRALETVNVASKLSCFNDYWSPKIVGELNDSYVKLVKFRGEFLWHHHAREDELFLVVKGTLRMKVRDGDQGEHELIVRAGEFLIVPHGTEHMPIAEEEVHVLLMEPKTTLNTGNITTELTVTELQRL
jgi:mannose-6-phosphate isomerase-like protein (cupin superfamily)